MQTTKFLSLVRQLIGKNLVTEDDSPADFSMGGATSGSTEISSDMASATTDTTTTTTDTNTTSDNNSDLSDLGLPDSGMGGAGLSPSYDVDVDVNDDQQSNEQNAGPAAPKYRILDVIFDDDDDLNTKVKIQNIETGKVEIKKLDEIII